MIPKLYVLSKENTKLSEMNATRQSLSGLKVKATVLELICLL